MNAEKAKQIIMEARDSVGLPSFMNLTKEISKRVGSEFEFVANYSDAKIDPFDGKRNWFGKPAIITFTFGGQFKVIVWEVYFNDYDNGKGEIAQMLLLNSEKIALMDKEYLKRSDVAHDSICAAIVVPGVVVVELNDDSDQTSGIKAEHVVKDINLIDSVTTIECEDGWTMQCGWYDQVLVSSY